MIKRSYYLSLICCLSLLCCQCAQESGCNDPTALNYNPDAEKSDGSCIYTLTEIPTSYQFYRQQVATINYDAEILTQLRINDLYLYIKSLGTSGAVLLTDTSALKNRYETADNLDILSSTGAYSPQQMQYNDIASGIVLRNKIIDTYNADSMILAWIDTITHHAQQPNLIGTNAVYTTANGTDLAEMIHKTQMGAILYAQSISKLKSLLNADNTYLVSEANYTAMEHQWDMVWGLFGAPRNYNTYTNTNYQDDNNDNAINFKEEYAYNWATDALARTNTSNTSNFRNDALTIFIKGRVAITAKNDTAIIKNKNALLLLWEKIAVANIIHYANALHATLLIYTGEQDPILPNLNAQWSALKASIMALQYKNGHLLSTQTDTLLTIIGEKPPHLPTNSPENEQYLNGIAYLKEIIQPIYGFSNTEMENW